MKLFFPNYALNCINTIEENGFEAWFVGGAVRDALLNREFYDVDITTNALPEDIIKIFPKTIPTGIKHGTVTVIIDDKPIEVTTYRSDIGYSDSRHPESVRFESSISADLSRRDFTINALAYHPKRGILDLFNGIQDLTLQKIRAVGDPELRFNEDALRILRALRFSSVLDFSIDEATLKAANNSAERLQNLSGERVLTELKKLACGKKPAIIEPLIRNGHLSHFGILSAVGDLNTVSKISEIYAPQFLLALCNIDENIIKNTLKPDNEFLKNTLLIKEMLTYQLPLDKTELKRLYNRIGEANIKLYHEAIKLIASEETVYEINGFKNEIIKNAEPFSISHLKITGNDLLSLGLKGEEIGKCLNHLIQLVIVEPQLNDTSTLLSKIN